MPGRRSYRKAVGELSERQKLRKERDEYYRTIRSGKGRLPPANEAAAASKLASPSVTTLEKDAPKVDQYDDIRSCWEPQSVPVPAGIEPQLVPISLSLQEFASRNGLASTAPVPVSASDSYSGLSTRPGDMAKPRMMHLPEEKMIENIGVLLQQAIRAARHAKSACGNDYSPTQSLHSEGSASTCTGGSSSSGSESEDAISPSSSHLRKQ
mmetsp:Transcript_86582/g.149841  ORF Transcript_86582/g.149841 Transcript_86582/m.149841 type:complete len:210 (-) Transcript_86582:209-838(-)